MLKTWFYNTRFSVKADSTSDAMTKSLDLLAGMDARGFSSFYDEELEEYYIRFSLIGIGAESPLEAYSELRYRLIDNVESISFDEYSIANGTVHFSVDEHLTPKLEGESNVTSDTL